MNQSKELRDNLNFVSEVVKSSEKDMGVPSIYFLWAFIVPVGFILTDFYPQLSGNFWMVMGPVGGAVSGYFGWKYSKKVGQIENKELQRNVIHWGAMLISIYMASSLVSMNMITGRGLGAVTLLLVSLSYILAGNYLDRALLWLGIIMMVGFYPIVNSVGYTWSIIGVAVSIGLLTAGFKALKDANK
jgi:hypothetical protein